MKIKSFSIFYLPIFLFFSIFIHSADKYYPGSSWNLVSAESQGIETKNVKTLRIKPKFNTKLLKFYDKFIFPYIKYLDIVGAPFIGKNILIVAKVTK